MEPNSETGKIVAAQPVENDLFTMTEKDSVQPASGQQDAEFSASAQKTATINAEPEPLKEPEFKINPEGQPPAHIPDQSSSAAAGPSASDNGNPMIALRSGTDASLGNLLTEARNASGYSIETVSQESHIRHDFIEALESDRADALPNYVFLRAYVRALIRFYNLDRASTERVEKLMDEFQPEQDVPEKLVEDIGRGGQISETETRRIRMVLIYGSIILFLLVSLVVTSVVAVGMRSKRVQEKQLQQNDKPFDSARLETLIPPQLPQPQLLPVPAAAEKKTGGNNKE